MVALPFSGFVNEYRFGAAFNYHTIARDRPGDHTQKIKGIYIERDADGNIIALNDGKRVPIVLGSIPRSTDNIKELRKKYNLSEDALIFIFTLNRKFERDFTGLSDIVKKATNNTLLKYPTTDFSAPTLIDLLRIVRDLKNRDDQQEELVLVHCKSGRGRSSTGVAAYLLCVLHDAGIKTDHNQIEQYLKSQRPQVSLNDSHKKALTELQLKLKKAGSFDTLYKHYEKAIQKRDKEVKKL